MKNGITSARVIHVFSHQRAAFNDGRCHKWLAASFVSRHEGRIWLLSDSRVLGERLIGSDYINKGAGGWLSSTGDLFESYANGYPASPTTYRITYEPKQASSLGRNGPRPIKCRRCCRSEIYIGRYYEPSFHRRRSYGLYTR